MPAAAGTVYRHRRRRARRGGAINEINMTPFIDVMLVLLIIFMVAAPLMTVCVPLDLPQTRAAPLNVDAKPVTLSIRQTGQVFLGEAELKDGEIVPRRPGDVDRDRGRVQTRRARDGAGPQVTPKG